MANEDGDLKCIFGILRDASPDVWESRIIEKHAGCSDLTEVDFLLNSPEGRAGALSFGRGGLPKDARHGQLASQIFEKPLGD